MLSNMAGKKHREDIFNDFHGFSHDFPMCFPMCFPRYPSKLPTNPHLQIRLLQKIRKARAPELQGYLNRKDFMYIIFNTIVMNKNYYYNYCIFTIIIVILIIVIYMYIYISYYSMMYTYMSNVYICIHTRICIMLNYILYCIVSTEIYKQQEWHLASPDPIDVTGPIWEFLGCRGAKLHRYTPTHQWYDLWPNT